MARFVSIVRTKKPPVCSNRRPTASIVSLLLLLQGIDFQQHRRTGESFLAPALPDTVADTALRPMLPERPPRPGRYEALGSTVLTAHDVWHGEAVGNGQSRSEPRRRCAGVRLEGSGSHVYSYSSDVPALHIGGSL